MLYVSSHVYKIKMNANSVIARYQRGELKDILMPKKGIWAYSGIKSVLGFSSEHYTIAAIFIVSKVYYNYMKWKLDWSACWGAQDFHGEHVAPYVT